ncbi:MAG: phage terminase large subunit family protein [Kordiimonadaceae bacterium]|nr:phage terminase large subunit family protein [Kordiimonadaceae bacterium]
MFLPPPKLKISEWADEFRQLSAGISAEPGQWRTSRTPYLREPMDAFVDPTVMTIVCMFCTQVGKSELLNNVIGYFIHQDPSTILLIQPTIKTANDYSKERLAPMIRDTPVLADVVGDNKTRSSENTISVKTYPGGTMAVIGANAPSGLASRPRRIVLGDEVDRYPASAGDEGDPFNLARKRAKTFWNKKFGLVSSPTIKGESRIEEEFELSDQRRFYVICEDCDHSQTLKWSNVHWDKDAAGDGDANTAYMSCETCGAVWYDAIVNRMVKEATGKGGGWIASKPFRGIAGFHLNELYSPWVPLSEIVQDWLDAKGKPEKLKIFVNTTLAETWDDSRERLEPGDLKNRREAYTPEELPGMEDDTPGPLVITGGIDTQDDRLELGVYAWGLGQECWFVEQVVFNGNPADLTDRGPWHELIEYIKYKEYPTSDGRVLKIEASCLDTGGHFTTEAYRFCSANKRYRVFAIKGQGGEGRPLWPVNKSRAKKVRVDLYHLGVDQGKSTIYARLRRIEAPGPGYIHFPQTADNDYFDQLTSEKVVSKAGADGRKVRKWVVPADKRNEALDCVVYAYAALFARDPSKKKDPDKYLIGRHRAAMRQLEKIGTVDTDSKQKTETQETKPTPRRKRGKRARPRAGGFVTNW